MNRLTNIIIIGLLVLIVGSFLADQSSSAGSGAKELKYSEFMAEVTNGNVKAVILDEGELRISGDYRSGGQFWTVMSRFDEKLIDTLVDRGVQFEVVPLKKPSIFM